MKNTKFTKTILRKTLMSYLLLLVIFIGIWVGGIKWLSALIEKQNQIIYGNLLDGISYSTDKELLIAERAALSLTLSTASANMLTSFRENKKEILLIKEVKDSMVDIMQNQTAIKNCMIYMKDADYITAYNTTGQTLTYYRTYVKELGIGYQEWLDFLNSINGKGYYRMDTDKTPVIYYASMLPINSREKEAVVLMQINDSVVSEQKFTEKLDNINLEIVADNGTTIVSCERGENSQVVQVKSADTGWNYIGYVENSDFDGTLSRITFWLIAGVAVSTAACGISVYLSLRNHYRPIKTIVQNLSAVIENPYKRKDEYEYISNSLELLVNRQKQDANELEQQGERLKDVYLQYLFSGRARAQTIRDEDLSLLGMEFIQRGFFLAFFRQGKQMELKKDGIYVAGERKAEGVYVGQRRELVGYFLKEEAGKNLLEHSDSLPEGTEIYLSSLHHGGEEVFAAGEEIEQLFRNQLKKTGILYYEEYQQEKKQNHLMEEILACIEKNYKNPDLTVESVCQELNKSVSGVNKQLKESGEESILYFISLRRVEEAKKLFQESGGQLPVKEVMQMVGYTNLNTFIRVFKKYEGITPGAYCEHWQNAQ